MAWTAVPGATDVETLATKPRIVWLGPAALCALISGDRPITELAAEPAPLRIEKAEVAGGAWLTCRLGSVLSWVLSGPVWSRPTRRLALLPSRGGRPRGRRGI